MKLFGFVITLGSITGALVACSSVYADPIEAPYSFGGFSSSSSGVIPVYKETPTPCPTSVHDNGPCDLEGSACEFGKSSDPDCNSTYLCTRSNYGAYWAETIPPHCAGKCPDPKQIVDGAPCTLTNRPDSGIPEESLELQCEGPTTLCACTTGPDGAHLHDRRWVCVPAGALCPIGRPNVGTPCLGEHVCDYGACEFKRGTGMTCTEGVWKVEAPSCR